jgi:hypothetical protein
MRFVGALCVGLLAVCPAVAADVNSALVTISPAPGLSFQLPRGWVACDPDTDKLLGGASDPSGLRKSVCTPIPGVDYVLRVFNPEPFRTISMTVSYSKEQQVSADMLKAITPDMIPALTTGACPEASKPMTSDGTKVESCSLEIATVYGQPAIHMSFVATPPPPATALARFTIETYELPYPHGYLLIQFNTPVLMRPVTWPMIQAILSSIKVE